MEAQKIKKIKLLSNLSEINLKNLKEMQKTINNIPQETLIHQMFYNLFRLFNKSTYRVYSGEVYLLTSDTIRTKFFENLMINMNYQFPDSILLRLQYVKLFDRFEVFFPNHLITERAKYNPNPVLFIGETFLQKSYFYVEIFIQNEFDWYEKYMSFHKRKTDVIIEKVKKYLIKGLLVLVYKFLLGIKCHISILVDRNKISEILKNVDNIVDQITSRNSQFERLLVKKDIKNKVILKTQRKILNKKQIKAKKIKFYSSVSENFEKNVSEHKEERPYKIFSKLRENLEKGIFLVSAYFKNKDYNYLINRYTRIKKIPKKTDYMHNKLKSSLNFINTKKIHNLKNNLFSEKKISNKKTNYSNYYKPLINEYITMKSFYNKNPQKNQFYQILNDSRDMRYIKTFLLFFIDQISIMEMDFKNNDHNKIFLLNDYFIYLFIIVDNLIKWNPLVREALLEILNSKEFGIFATKVFQKIWSFFILLYLIVMYKTFMDDDWMEYWSKFYVLSKFLQNLCEKNNQGFKKFLSKIPGTISKFTQQKFNQNNYTLYFELYVILETSANYSNFWLNKNGDINPSDKSEMFMIFKRLMDHTTEHFTGPCLKNQLKIYMYRIDIWAGIIKRVINDTDSDFYKLKLSCLFYISGLLEGLNDSIVTLMGSNFQIHELFEMSMRLVKKLYIRMLRKIKKKIKSRDFGNLSIVTKNDEDRYEIMSNFVLNEFYMIYENDFSEHILLDIVIQTYFLMKNLSLKIKFYEFYLLEKNEKIFKLRLKENLKYEKTKFYNQNKIINYKKLKNYQKKKEKRKMKGEALIFQFIQNITSKIEIIHVEQKLIRRINFKKEPKTFLLSSQSKKKFIENIDHTNLHTKHIDLFDNLYKFDLEMNFNKQKYSKIGILYKYTTNDFFTSAQILLYFCSIILNIFMLFYFDADHVDNKNKNVTDLKNDSGSKIVDSTAIVICFLSFFLSIYWLLIKLKWEIKKEYLLKIKKGKKFNFIKNITQIIFFHPRFTSFFFHFFFTTLGLLYSNWYYTFNLFLVTNLSKTISYILQSIIKHYEKLIVTLILTILIIYSYSFLLLTYFNTKIKEDDFGGYVCNDFLNCFFNSINMGVRMGGGISDFLFLITNPEKKNYWQRFFFDITFFILIQLISLNIFSGIIIDTFGDMRDELTMRKFHETKVCFICGLNKWDIEKKGESFKIHRNETHNIWDYIAFMIRLNSGDQEGFTGEEFQIYQMLRNEDTGWLPKGDFLKKGVNQKVVN